MLAASFQRKGGGRCWVLPQNCPAAEAWVAVALKEFREVDPDRVPALPAWWERPEWGTLDQQKARAAIADLQAERVRLLKEVDEQLLAAHERVSVADEAAAEGASRLLTADGDELANAVRAALQALGFEVDDMDETHPAGDRREDLRVRDPDQPSWEAIVEVKGYTKGAAINDLRRLYRWAERYILEKHRRPDARWHVVNAFRRIDPAARGVPLQNGADLHDFTEDDGLLIDTRQLFSILRTVELGTADLSAIREELRTARGRWQSGKEPPGSPSTGE